MLYNYRYKESGLLGNIMLALSVAWTFIFISMNGAPPPGFPVGGGRAGRESGGSELYKRQEAVWA
jgi:hypothetical protein